ncbi:hypothetical protein DM860_006317 [Cuscuta australis]|uniref:Uncharacterized protein n=1 Tax=Cuscuta australis TaxID=267555 RepID=A0A328DQ91_9ASTE|nr:hypothetical protein DM860_006317 [Cuscuta australis]
MEEKRNVNPIVFCDLTSTKPCQNSLVGTLSRNPPPLQTLDLLKNLGCSSSSSSSSPSPSPPGKKKHPHPDDNNREFEDPEEQRRKRKHSVVYGYEGKEEDDEDDVELSEMFDRFLLCSDPNEYSMNIQPAAAGKVKEIGRVKHDDDEHNKNNGGGPS